MSLRHNVATLLREAIGATREYEIDDVVLVDEEAPRQERVTGTATFLRTKEGVLVTAHLEGAEHEPCSRCLADVTVPVRIDFEEEYYPVADLRTGAPVARPENPEAFRIDAEHKLDLEEAIRQSWATAEPMQPLCRPDCRGLCSRCGQDLNEGPCACQPDEDERWSPLRKLAGKLEGI
jgi:uncharacterized protein